MPAVVVATAASAWLLLGAGLMKIRRPEGTQEAIRTIVGSKGPLWQSRLLGLVEVGIGAAFLVMPGPIPAAALGLAYALTFVSALALKRRDVDCGCFGADSSRVGTYHLVVTAVAAVTAFALTVGYEPYPGTSVYALVVSGIPVALGCYALIAPLTSLRTGLAELSS
jgi:uncharacterized membrane protein YphA (DoxX/SURF4 family)